MSVDILLKFLKQKPPQAFIPHYFLKKVGAGFTLIELLVVIALIGVLTTVTVVTLNPGKKIEQTRDAQRKTDLRSISNALQAYYLDKLAYPDPGPDLISDSSEGSDWIPGLGSASGYLKFLPKDPKQASVPIYIVFDDFFEIFGGKINNVFAASTIYYVDCFGGNDLNDGTSEVSAWKTITKVNNSAFSVGDQVLFKRGVTCFGNLRLTANKNGIYVGAYGSGELPIIKSTTWQYGAVNFEGSGITVENIWVTADPVGIESGCGNNPTGYRLGFAFASGSTNNVIRFSKATGLWAGVDFRLGSSNNKLLNSEILDNIMMNPLNILPDTEPGGGDAGAFGIIFHGDNNEAAYNIISGHDACSYDYGRDGGAAEIFGGIGNYIHHNLGVDNDAFTETGDSRSDNNTIAYNVVMSTLDKSSFLNTRGQTNYGPVKHTKVYNNTVYLTGANSQGIICSSCYLSGDSSLDAILTAKNNIIWAEKKAAYSSQQFDESNNIYWDSGGSPLIQGFTIDATSEIVDPEFVLPGTDFHLQPTSLAIDTGVAVGYNQDYEGTVVPQGAAVDVGAYEYSASSSPTPTSPPSSPTPTSPPSSPTPTSPPLPESPAFKYLYKASPDFKSFTLWTGLENSDDAEIYSKPNAKCKEIPPDSAYNFCVSSN